MMCHIDIDIHSQTKSHELWQPKWTRAPRLPLVSRASSSLAFPLHDDDFLSPTSHSYSGPQKYIVPTSYKLKKYI
jgi:hypothetical protein